MIIFEQEFKEGKLKTKLHTIDEIKKEQVVKNFSFEDLSFTDDPEYLWELDYMGRIRDIKSEFKEYY